LESVSEEIYGVIVNRRTFLKVLIGTVAVLAIDPLKVLAEQPQQIPKKELDFEIERIPIKSAVHERKPGLEIKNAPDAQIIVSKDAKIIDLVRISYPAMLAHQICSVQPMTQQTGEIFKIRYVPKPWYKRMGNWFKRTPKVKDGCWGGGCCK
jgi:hypothetical protein